MEQENEEMLVKITDICRACLNRTDNMKFLLEDSEETTELISKFVSVANMEIELDFKFPSYMCTICEEKIINCYEFQQQCQKSNDLIQEYLAVFTKQDTISSERELEIPERKFDLSEQINNEQASHPTIENQNHCYEEITNTATTPPCELNEPENLGYEENFQEPLKSIISDLQEKFKRDDVCVFCDFHASNSKHLSVHVSRVHKEVKNTWCSVCNKIFSNVEAHSAETHKDGFTCQFCHLQFSTVKSIIEHLYSHQESSNIDNVNSKESFKTHAVKNLAKCKFDSKELPAKKTLQNHKCSKVVGIESTNFVDEIQKETDKGQIEIEQNTLLGKEITNNHLEQFKHFKPKEVSARSKTLQRMRLKQYCAEDVEKVMRIVREKFYKHVTCTFCSFTAITNRSLSVHVTRVHREYKGKWCSSCNQIIENVSLHNKEVHYEDLKCPFCKKIMSNMGHFMEHLASHSVERLHKCDVCYKSFISVRHLRIHREKHIKERSFKCEFCPKTFCKTKDLNFHLKTHQSSDNNDEHILSRSIKDDDIKIENEKLSYISDLPEKTESIPSKPHNFCKECNKNVRSLPSHYSKHHDKTNLVNGKTQNEKQNLCPHCGKRFKTISKLTVHIRTHTGESPYKCQYCEKRVKTRNILVLHERTHTGEKPYMCSVCGKSFAQSSVLNTHTRIHTGRPEQCTICEKRFCRPAELRLHMRKHTGEKPYVCDICGQGFKQKSHLVEHTKTHNDDRPYKCEYCEKAFKNNGTLKCHLQIHSGQKPFKCSQCSYACRQPYSLTQHMVQHENDKPQPDNPHKCQLCQKNYLTLAHLTAHLNRYHSGVNIKSLEEVDQLLTDNQIVTPDGSVNIETREDNQIDYQISQENQIEDSSQIEPVQNIDTMIIHTEIVQDGIKFEPMIQFTTLEDL